MISSDELCIPENLKQVCDNKVVKLHLIIALCTEQHEHSDAFRLLLHLLANDY